MIGELLIGKTKSSKDVNLRIGNLLDVMGLA